MGLSIHNRKFYYDNYSKSLIPIYYDIDSQLETRDLTFPQCNEELTYQYQVTSCINNLALSASEILDQIDFNSQQIYQNLKLKNINVPKEYFDTIFNKFILNLDQISQMGSSSFQFSENSLKNFQINYLNKINNPILGFYYPDLKTNLLYLCDTYMKECVQSDEKIRLIKNDLIYEENVYHLISFDIENQINKNLYKIDEKIYLKDFGNSEVLIDYANKISTIIKDSKRILMFGDEF